MVADYLGRIKSLADDDVADKAALGMEEALAE